MTTPDPEIHDTVQMQDTAFSPPSYPHPEPGAMVTWRTVIVDGVELAAVYTDYIDSLEMRTPRSKPQPIAQIRQFIRNMRYGNVPAGMAYDAITRMDGIEFGPEQRGPIRRLDQVTAQLMKNSAEMD